MEIVLFVRDTLFYMNITGMNPENQSPLAKARAAATIVLGSFVSIFLLLDVVLNWTGVDSLLEGSDVFVALVEVIMKAVLMVVYNQRIKKLLDSVRKFRSAANTGEAAKQEVQAIHNFVAKLRRGFKICYVSTNIIFFVKPLIIRSRILPLPIYQPFDLQISPRYEIAYLLVYVNSVLLMCVQLSFDLLFILFVTHAVCELKALKYEFANLKIGDQNESLAEISKLVEQHAFVLGFIKEFDDLISVLMLTEFVASTFCICLGLFSMSGEGFPPNPTTAVKYALFLLSFAGELYIFCVGGNVLTEESASVANAVYESGWWMKTQPKLRRAIVLVMLRAQKAQKLTVGGMFDLDLNCFSSVINTAFSFFTFIQAMQNEAKEDLLQ